MARFEVPSEFRDFVSSTDDLFSQLNEMRSDSELSDAAQFSVFFDER